MRYKILPMHTPGLTRLRPSVNQGHRYHYFSRTSPVDWMHVTVKPDGTDRDWQVSKVYAAERTLPSMGEEPMNWTDTLTFLADVMKSAKFRRRWGSHGLIVSDGRGCTWARGGEYEVKLPRWSRKRLVILHELAHAICPGWEHHGRLFCRTYLELVRLFMGKAEHDQLRDAFRAGKVKFNPRRAK